MAKEIIVVAGATGALGKKLVRELQACGAQARAIVRASSDRIDVENLRQMGAEIVEIDTSSVAAVTEVCRGASCVISTLAGLRPAIIEAQMTLLQGAVAAGVPRFIPSDFSADFYKVPAGRNRNLDLRREFSRILARQPIQVTSILNGMFSEFLFTGAPFVVFEIKRSVFFGRKNQRLDFTAMDDVAAFTARAALDEDAPRFLRIAGHVCTPAELARQAQMATGDEYKTLRGGSLAFLRSLIFLLKTLDFKQDSLYPVWQGMQYVDNMSSGQAKLKPLDNDRYSGFTWTPLHETLAAGKPDFID